MQTLKARKPMRYGGRRLQAGDVFSAASNHARLLVAVGAADVDTVPPPKPARQAPRRAAALLAPPIDAAGDLEDAPPADPADFASIFEPPAAADADQADAADPDKPRRTYRRRDMTAGD